MSRFRRWKVLIYTPTAKWFEFFGAMLRTVATVTIMGLWLFQPRPIALIVPSDTQVPHVLNSYTFVQDEPKEEGPQEHEVQVTGGKYSRIGLRNVFQELNDQYYILTSHCNEDANMDFAIIRVFRSGYMELDFDHGGACTIVDITFHIPHNFDENR